MTAALEPTRVARGRPGAGAPKTFASAFASAALAIAVSAHGHAWPSEHYRTHPVEFFREVLGVEPWSRQIEIIEAVRDNMRVSVRSGHKVSKSTSAAGLALWWYCSYPDARAVMSSVTSRQVDEILWRELTMRKARARVPIGGVIGKLARTGLKSTDFRQIVGFTARQAEAVAGISGANLLYILDEASGIPETIFHAIEGNRAGGAKVVLFSNPTKNEGEFFESHHSKRHLYTCIHISSEESPNVVEGRSVIPGLATREWIEEKREEWGVDSAIYQVRVRGEFPREEASKVVQLHLVLDAEQRWEDAPAAGRLHVGLDPVGQGDDDFGMVARRGGKVLEVTTAAPPPASLKTPDEVADWFVAKAVEFINRHRTALEGAPAVKVDTTGGAGNLGGRFAAKLRQRFGESKGVQLAELEVFSVDASAKSTDGRFPLMRDALWFGVAEWLRAGGALPPEKLSDGTFCAAHDKKLVAELTAPGFALDLHERPKVDKKDIIREKIKRSPDRADAVGLAIYEPSGARAATRRDPPPPNLDWFEQQGRGIDPYAALDAVTGRGPYGGRHG